MLIDDVEAASSGRLEGPETDASILAVVFFVEKNLVDFSKRYADSGIENEKGLTQKLVLLLNANARREERLFFFDKEFMEDPEKGHSPQVDIGTITTETEGIAIESKKYGDDESFFSMEAKRLGALGKKRSREYLIGRWEGGKYVETGGVERFKKNIHGKNLNYGALIAYVQKHDFYYWHKTINAWIDDLISGNIQSRATWSLKDKLQKKYIERLTAKFISSNTRKNGSNRLFHLWVYLGIADS